MHNKAKHDFIRFTFLICAFLFLIFNITETAAIHSQDTQMHLNARHYIRLRNWEKAIHIYENLLTNYPVSEYRDDAMFWIGFCYEQNPETKRNAFNHFQRFVSEYPNSVWINDAVIHQIDLAKKLCVDGEKDYESFIRLKLASDDPNIANHAAIALAKLGDSTVAPLLHDIIQGENEALAREAMLALNNLAPDLEKLPGYVEIAAPDTSFYSEEDFFISRLKKTGGHWTEQALFDNGMYHILNKETLAEYLKIENPWERRQWWYRYWKSQDPEPTTEGNEAEGEFKRRVLFAWENYGQDWDFESRLYPPWDARGEIYIKLGEPDWINHYPHNEHWLYYRNRVSLIIERNKPAVSGRVIRLSRHSRTLRFGPFAGSHLEMLPQAFIYHPKIFDAYRNLKNVSFDITNATVRDEHIKADFKLSLPAKSLRTIKNNSDYKSAFLYRWVVFDNNYNQIDFEEKLHHISNTQLDFFKNHIIEIPIEMALPPGSYYFAVRVEDQNSQALSIQKKSFTLGAKDINE